MQPYEERIEGMLRQIEDWLKSLHYQGFVDGKLQGSSTAGVNYQEGLSEGKHAAWRCAGEIARPKGEPEYSEFCNFFGVTMPYKVITNYHVDAAIDKMKEWYERKGHNNDLNYYRDSCEGCRHAARFGEHCIMCERLGIRHADNYEPMPKEE